MYVRWIMLILQLPVEFWNLLMIVYLHGRKKDKLNIITKKALDNFFFFLSISSDNYK